MLKILVLHFQEFSSLVPVGVGGGRLALHIPQVLMDDVESVRATSEHRVDPRLLERRAEGLPQWVIATQKQRECIPGDAAQ
jgi:hypothetical protein